MALHKLKTLIPYFNEIWNGNKLFEVRFDDRNYQLWDVLQLQEFDGDNEIYTEREIISQVMYILNDKRYCKPGYVIMSLRIVDKIDFKQKEREIKCFGKGLMIRELELQHEALCRDHPEEKAWQAHILRKLTKLKESEQE